jgi:ribosomal protein S18 acetylase RimI-like enzyme
MPRGISADLPGAKVKSVFCFAFATVMKRQGIATRLLERACRDAAEEGFDAIEAYPNKSFVNEFKNFMGPLALYTKLGFAAHGENKGKYKDCLVMWKELGG